MLCTHGISNVQTELQSTVTMDRARPSYSAATTVTVETETCCLFFLSATEESLQRVLITLCCFVAMLLASQSLEHHLWPHGNYCHASLLTTPFITLAGRLVTVSARLLNCSALGKFGSEFVRWPTVIIHSDLCTLSLFMSVAIHSLSFAFLFRKPHKHLQKRAARRKGKPVSIHTYM